MWLGCTSRSLECLSNRFYDMDCPWILHGLPVDFTAVLYKVQNNKEADLTKALDKFLGNNDQIEEDEGDMDEYHDFVFLKFDA